MKKTHRIPPAIKAMRHKGYLRTRERFVQRYTLIETAEMIDRIAAKYDKTVYKLYDEMLLAGREALRKKYPD